MKITLKNEDNLKNGMVGTYPTLVLLVSASAHPELGFVFFFNMRG